MAQIVKRKNKNGSTSYLFRVSTGYDRNGKQVTTSRTFTPPPTLTGRKLEKEVRRRADEFEREVHNGLALDANMKLDDLIDRWFSEYIDKKCKPKTGVEYRYLHPHRRFLLWEQEAASSSLATPIKGKTAKSCRNICAFCGFLFLYFCLKADWNAHKKCDILISQTNQNQEVSRHAQTQRKQE